MKQISLFGILSLLTTFFCSLRAEGYKVEEVPMVHLQDRTRYVSNPDGILSDDAVAVIDTTLFALEQKTGIQTVVVAVRQIEGGDCFDFAYQLGEKNGVGQKGKDNGLVILLVTEERCIQFATGYGLEGILPDAICKRIQTRYMNSYLSKGDWDSGMVAGIQAVRQVLDKSSSSEEESNGLLPYIVGGGLFFIIVFLTWVIVRKECKCPKCHKYTMNQTSSRTISDIGGIRTDEITYLCSNCGHVRHTLKKINKNFHHRGGNGNSSFGGGFSGGSFGGGSFGGGGAGSRF